MLSEHKLVPDAPAAGGLDLTGAGDWIIALGNTGRNDVVVVHANNLQFCINILFHIHYSF